MILNGMFCPRASGKESYHCLLCCRLLKQIFCVDSECTEDPTLSPVSSLSNLSSLSKSSNESFDSLVSRRSILQTLDEQEHSRPHQEPSTLINTDDNQMCESNVQSREKGTPNAASPPDRQLSSPTSPNTLRRMNRTPSHSLRDDFQTNSMHDHHHHMQQQQILEAEHRTRHLSLASDFTLSSSTLSFPVVTQQYDRSHSQNDSISSQQHQQQHHLTKTKPPASLKTRRELLASHNQVDDERSGRMSVCLELQQATQRSLHPLLDSHNPQIDSMDARDQNGSEKVNDINIEGTEDTHHPANTRLPMRPTPSLPDAQHDMRTSTVEQGTYMVEPIQRDEAVRSRFTKQVKRRPPKIISPEKEAKDQAKTSLWAERAANSMSRKLFQKDKSDITTRMFATRDEVIRSNCHWELSLLYVRYTPSLGVSSAVQAAKLMQDCLHRYEETCNRNPERWARYGQTHLLIRYKANEITNGGPNEGTGAGGSSHSNSPSVNPEQHLHLAVQAFEQAANLSGEKTEYAGYCYAFAARALQGKSFSL